MKFIPQRLDIVSPKQVVQLLIVDDRYAANIISRVGNNMLETRCSDSLRF